VLNNINIGSQYTTYFAYAYSLLLSSDLSSLYVGTRLYTSTPATIPYALYKLDADLNNQGAFGNLSPTFSSVSYLYKITESTNYLATYLL
jgi:hypothetical protein